MELAPVLTPFAAVIEIVIFVLAVGVGISSKKLYGWFFAITFLIFALFDILGQMNVSTETLAILNIIAVVAGLVGMIFLLKESCPFCRRGIT